MAAIFMIFEPLECNKYLHFKIVFIDWMHSNPFTLFLSLTNKHLVTMIGIFIKAYACCQHIFIIELILKINFSFKLISYLFC